MAALEHEPVAHDHEAFLVRARRRRGSQKAYDALESGGKPAPSIDTLQRYAKAVGCERAIELVAGSGRPWSEWSTGSSSWHGWLRARPLGIAYASPSGHTPSPLVRAALQS